MSDTVGFNPHLSLHKLTEEEKRVVGKFAQHWLVTNVGEVQYSERSKFRFALLKPAKIFETLFDINREVVLILSSYPTFEPRVLSLFDLVIQEADKHRIEKLCYVIAAKDNAIAAKVYELVRKESEEIQTVVPFSYSEVLNSTSIDFVLNRFRTCLYNKDLFSFQGPLKKDIYFFGRNDLVLDIIGRHKAGENCGLFGLRKAGKTSVIYGVDTLLSHS